MGDQGDPVTLEPVGEYRRDELFDMFARIVADGDGFPQAAPLTREVFDQTWMASSTSAIGAFRGGELLGAYYLKPNFAARAAHVANAGYMVDRAAHGAGVGRSLVEHSIGQAHADGYTAVIFNLVFESNPARALYEELGWRSIGRIPRGVDDEPAIIYWRDV